MHLATTIRTRSGRSVDVLNPDPSTIEIEDIAAALSRLCRYAGHTNAHYSVAQHSSLVYKIVKRLYPVRVDLHRWAIMHDAHEFALVDVPHPVKVEMRSLSRNGVSAYDELSFKMDYAIVKRFGLTLNGMPGEVKTVDEGLRADEQREFMGMRSKPVSYMDGIAGLYALAAESQFLHDYHEAFNVRANSDD